MDGVETPEVVEAISENTPISTNVENVENTETIVPVEPEIPEQVYTYQPTDDKGRPLGGKQVIKYKTTEELTQKLTEQNVQLVRKLREESKKARLGIVDDAEIPETATKFTQVVEFKPRELSPDERYQLSRDLLDPEKCEAATNILLEARLGAKPEAVSSAFNKIAQDNMKIMAKVESDAFLANNPDYFPCRDNFDILTGFMLKRDLEPTRENFQLAYETLKKADLFVTKPEVVPVVEPIAVAPAPIVTVPVETVEESKQEASVPVKRPPTGLNNSHTGESNATPKKYKYTLKDINSMPSEEYKKNLLTVKGFAEMVDELERESQPKRNK